jgi:hypothetical protein
VRGLGGADRRELDVLRTFVTARVNAGALRLNARGREAVRLGELKVLGDELAAGDGPAGEALVASRELVLMARKGYARLDGGQSRLERYARLQIQWDRATVGAFVAPLRDSDR